MYYQNGNYMQDLNYYNQNPSYPYNPYGNNFQNPNGNTQMPMGQMPQPNLNALYPAVYRIIAPVVSQVLANTNTGYITEESLNNMVDTVYSIVEGDINLGNPTNTNTNTSENSNPSNCERNTPTSRQSTSNPTNTRTNTQNVLLRDLIKIMILNEISCRRQNNPQNRMMPNQNMTQPMFL